ncbi:zinc-ribbon domain-containing protein [Paracoccus sp. (in: a-proteobacteria)]|uniref:zinc-ribbon domain-containing protein n=1 Tax=Paracoccus sp. TaxID=267 RepID=UPI0032206202
MRLTCPSCRAQYQIADSAIPASGREVECSACGHVWHEPAPAAADAGPEAAFDAGARPRLHRPLDDSILSILREETARELRAREAPDTEPADAGPALDSTLASVAPATPNEPDEPGAAGTPATPGSPEAQPAEPAPASLPDAALLAATLAPSAPAAEDLAENVAKDAPGAEPHLLLRPDPGEQTKPAAPPPAPALQVAAPAPAPPPRRRGYASGLGLALLLALGLLAAYALAPRPAPGKEGGALDDMRRQVDRGRLWLHDRILGE